jgi:ABC-type transport system involved in multi-copper enzyme maturation permease subunit
VSVVLAGMVIVWLGRDGYAAGPGRRAPTFQQMAKVGEGFFYALAGIQISLVLLAAPAAAAGAICMDRARGTLLHVLTTDLSDVEIVVGKLAARLTPIIGMIACGLPVAALAALLGGIEFEALWGAFAVSLALAVLGCALALTVSIWATKTHEVLMAVYLFEGFWLLALPIWWAHSLQGIVRRPPAWFQKANPYALVFAPYNQPGLVQTVDYVVFCGCVLALAAALVGLSVLKLRRVVVDLAGRPEKATRRLPAWTRVAFPTLIGPSLDGNPVLWREWHRNRPSRFARRLWVGLLLVTWGLVAWGTYELATKGFKNGPSGLGFGLLIQLAFGFLMLSATAPTVLAEERVRGSLDVLLATPLSTRTIVVGKWWGAYRRVFLLALLPLYVAILSAATMPGSPNFPPGVVLAQPVAPLTLMDRILSASFCAADFLVSGAMIVSLGVALATWVRRLGRAVAVSVIAFVLMGIGLIVLLELAYLRLVSSVASSQWIAENHWVVRCVMSLSPIVGPVTPLDTLFEFAWRSRMRQWAGIGVVALIKLAIAWFFFWLTVRTFDRCLGRTPELRSRSRSLQWPLSGPELAPSGRSRALCPGDLLPTHPEYRSPPGRPAPSALRDPGSEVAPERPIGRGSLSNPRAHGLSS